LLASCSGPKSTEVVISPDNPDGRAQILLRSPSILLPCVTHAGVKIRDTLSIAQHINEASSAAGSPPSERAARACAPIELAA
jgi:glutathione S-transferase